MCASAGGTCACRLSSALDRLPSLEALDLTHNDLPDAGLFLDTIARAGHGGLSYNAVANVSRDANGDAYTVQCVRPASRTASRKVRSEPVRVSEHRARARARSSSSPLARN